MEFENFEDLDTKRPDVFENRLEEALRLKQKGNVFFQQEDYFNAEYFYHCALYHVDFDPMQWNFELLDIHREKALEVKVPVCLNLAAVRIHLENFDSAVHLCNEVLKDDPNNSKALYRKALALKALKEYEGALQAVSTAFNLCPKNSQIFNLRKELKRLNNIEYQKAKKLWKGKFKTKTKKFSFKKALSMLNPLNLHYFYLPPVI
mmetsp:Transcript_3803/g.5802  ORF Transcript_3803/g.5802 Transcript_3803/m.5802 type:complete len:205 (+) Transcript_3803:23-637(+)